MAALIFYNPIIHGKRQGWKTGTEDVIGKPMEIPSDVFKPKIKEEHKTLGIYDVSARTLEGKTNRINRKNPDQNYLSRDFIWITCVDSEKAKEIYQKIKESKYKFLNELFSAYAENNASENKLS
jgi:hypothetical protein